MSGAPPRGPGRRALSLLLAGGLLASWGYWRSRSAGTPPGPSWASRITEQTRATRPNLLLVVYDARRRDDFSFGPFGNSRGDTPFLARFKEQAIYFEDAVAPGCWTVPVHAAIFSGLSVCELGNDYYNPGWSALPDGFLSLPEIMRAAGYHTIAYPDHPYFYNSHENVSLIRGFEQFNVISDFERYTSATNIGTHDGGVVHQPRLPTGLFTRSMDEVVDLVRRFNGGRLDLTLEPADEDKTNHALLRRLGDLYRESTYFRDRYGREFDEQVFVPERRRSRPFFLFLNLHMATVARPDPALFARWVTRTLALNARRRGLSLPLPDPGDELDVWVEAAAKKIRLSHAPFPAASLYLKHVFDNRFYDSTFEAVVVELERRGLMRNTVTVVTSDHGMSLREKGESLYLHSGARPYEYLIRVPLVLRFPAGSAGAAYHARHAEAVSLIDLFPTLVDLALGREVFERALPTRGQNLVARLSGHSFEPYLVAEAACGPSPYQVAPGALGYAKAVISGGMKLVSIPEVYRTRTGGPGWPITVRLGEGWPLAPPRPELERAPLPLDQLFDLSVDPHEQSDLAPRRPEEVARLKALVRSWSCRSLPWGPLTPVWQGESLATLRSLGYIQ